MVTRFNTLSRLHGFYEQGPNISHSPSRSKQTGSYISVEGNCHLMSNVCFIEFRSLVILKFLSLRRPWADPPYWNVCSTPCIDFCSQLLYLPSSRRQCNTGSQQDVCIESTEFEALTVHTHAGLWCMIRECVCSCPLTHRAQPLILYYLYRTFWFN
jgi:hypothetical protein